MKHFKVKLFVFALALSGSTAMANYSCTVAGGVLPSAGVNFDLDTSLSSTHKSLLIRGNFEAGCSHDGDAKLLRCKFFWRYLTPGNETFTRIAAQSTLSDTRVATLETSDGTDNYILRCDQK